jgi:hypothetical protein
MTDNTIDQSPSNANEIDYNRIMSSPTRGELFNLLSNLFRIVTYQHMALMSLKNPNIDNFDGEMQESSTEIDGYLKELQKLIRSQDE